MNSKKNSDQNQFGNECVNDMVNQTHECNLQVKEKEGMTQHNHLEP
jgi:hypothetical protein